MVAPLGEKARPLEKDKASGAFERLEPLSAGGATGSRGAALGSTGTSRASNAAVQVSTGPILERDKAKNMKGGANEGGKDLSCPILWIL